MTFEGQTHRLTLNIGRLLEVGCFQTCKQELIYCRYNLNRFINLPRWRQWVKFVWHVLETACCTPGAWTHGMQGLWWLNEVGGGGYCSEEDLAEHCVCCQYGFSQSWPPGPSEMEDHIGWRKTNPAVSGLTTTLKPKKYWWQFAVHPNQALKT